MSRAFPSPSRFRAGAPFRATCNALASAALLVACGGQSPQALVASGKALELKGDRSAAVIQYKAALQADSNLLDARVLLGKALLEQGDAQGAAIELTRALEQKADPSAVVPGLANALVMLGEYKKVIHTVAGIPLKDKQAEAEVQTQLAIAWNAVSDPVKAEAALSAALRAVPDYGPAKLLTARATAGKGRLDEAFDLTEAMLAADPKFRGAWLLRGELLQIKGDIDGALDSFGKALALDPGYVPSHVAIINVRLAQRNLAEVKRQADQLRSVAGWHPASGLVDAQLAALEGDLPKARERIQKILSVLPDNQAALVVAGVVESRMGAVVRAIAHFQKALAANPALDGARTGLAKDQIRLGQYSDALETLKPLLAESSPAARTLAYASEAHMRMGNVKVADELLQRAAKTDPKNTQLQSARLARRLANGDGASTFADLQALAGSTSETYADEVLFSARLNRGEYDAALAALDGMAKKQPGNASHLELRGRVHLARRDFGASRQAFEQAVKLDPALFGAVASLVALDLLDKQPDRATARLQAVITADPQHSVALMAMAELKNRSGSPFAEVSKYLLDAIKASPLAPEPRLALIDLAIKKRQFKQALSFAQEAQTALPGDPRIMTATGAAQLQAGDVEQAATTFRRLAGAMSKSAAPYLKLAEVYKVQGKLDAADTAIKKALELEPENPEVQAAFVDSLAGTNPSKNALEYVQSIKRAKPGSPFGYSLEASYHVRQKNSDAALSVLREGLTKTDSADLAAKLFSLLLREGRDAEAGSFGDGWMKRYPKDAKMDYLLSVRDITRGDLKAAETRLRRVLAAYPANALALNNLAWVLVKTSGKEAVDYARRAVDVQPDRPELMDTLALALAADKQFAAAMDVQKRALELAPNDPGLRLGVARIALLAGDKSLARTELEHLKTLGPSFVGQAEVSKLMQAL